MNCASMMFLSVVNVLICNEENAALLAETVLTNCFAVFVLNYCKLFVCRGEGSGHLVCAFPSESDVSEEEDVVLLYHVMLSR